MSSKPPAIPGQACSTQNLQAKLPWKGPRESLLIEGQHPHCPRGRQPRQSTKELHLFLLKSSNKPLVSTKLSSTLALGNPSVATTTNATEVIRQEWSFSNSWVCIKLLNSTHSWPSGDLGRRKAKIFLFLGLLQGLLDLSPWRPSIPKLVC